MAGSTRTGMAERTGLEPATSNVTGWRSNQLSYRSIPFGWGGTLWRARQGCNTFFEVFRFFFEAAPDVWDARQLSESAYARSMVFDELEVWFDPVDRPGFEAMAVDEWLLEERVRPLLRIYGWSGKWGSFGYFGKRKEATEGMPGLDWVRRWTGGGAVDHSEDWTYSIIVPRGHLVAGLKGAESYRRIHEVLVTVLKGEMGSASLSGVGGESGSSCFENPVEHDVEDADGRKLAGAAQRRSKAGLLHQGSVRCPGGDGRLRGQVFTEKLARSWAEEEILVDEARVGKLVESKYGSRAWLERR